MKALVLAGGAGTRLRPITHTSAKQLVPVANKPILYYGLEAMVDAGITEIGIIVGDTRVEVEAAIGNGAAFGASVSYIPQTAPLGLAHCVLIADEFLGDDDFVMYLGDNLLEQDLRSFVDAFERARSSPQPPNAQILLKRAADPHRFGVATLDDDGHAVQLVEKPEVPRRTSRRRRLPVRPHHPRRRACDPALCTRRAGDHRCHPVAHLQWIPRPYRAADRLVDRHGQRRRCSKRIVSCSTSSSRASTVMSTPIR
ncbi:MAG: sugar phosphate nucleotidyltransferase [Ilumatobacteraceae bacterium]